MFKSVEHNYDHKMGKVDFCSELRAPPKAFYNVCSLVLGALLIIFVPDRYCCSNPLALSQATRQ